MWLASLPPFVSAVLPSVPTLAILCHLERLHMRFCLVGSWCWCSVWDFLSHCCFAFFSAHLDRRPYFWPDRSQSRCHLCLGQCLLRIRKRMDPPRGSERSLFPSMFHESSILLSSGLSKMVFLSLSRRQRFSKNGIVEDDSFGTHNCSQSNTARNSASPDILQKSSPYFHSVAISFRRVCNSAFFL